MEKVNIRIRQKQLLADTTTPVNIYLKIRDIFPQSFLLEGSDYHGNQNSYSFICLEPMAEFKVEADTISISYAGGRQTKEKVTNGTVPGRLLEFLNGFKPIDQDASVPVNGIFGYHAYDAVRYYENIDISPPSPGSEIIPEIRYHFFRYIIAINHFQNTLHIIENLPDGQQSGIDRIESLLNNRNIPSYHFDALNNEDSNLTDEEYMELVKRGKDHCQRGDVFQIVLSRQFSQQYTGDDFNVYRALRSINPSPYLFYFDYGSYRIFGSSPESQLEITENRAFIHPIAGTFQRSGNDNLDREMAERLMKDEKENAEHVMLVDLARNDLARNADDVKVEVFREIQFYSHVIHLVSKVGGRLQKGVNPVQVFADSFPAGTLSGAPKHMAMQLIDKYENRNRGYYGGAIGNIDLNGNLNHAIMIRSFLSKNNRLYYQAGAGIVSRSSEKNELEEVNNKLMALKSAIQMARNI